MKTLLICPWFGPLPNWMRLYLRSTSSLFDYGFDFLIDTDLDDFKRRVHDRLGVVCPITPGSSKIHDYRAALGELYSEVVSDYDWWGHTDFDCIYGRVERFYNDELLADLDVVTDCNDYICGPWTLYRPAVSSAFREYDGWEEILEEPQSSGWVEDRFTWLLNRMGLRIQYHQHHAYTEAQFLIRDERMLMHRGKEIPFFHFRHSKEWPL